MGPSAAEAAPAAAAAGAALALLKEAAAAVQAACTAQGGPHPHAAAAPPQPDAVGTDWEGRLAEVNAAVGAVTPRSQPGTPAAGAAGTTAPACLALHQSELIEAVASCQTNCVTFLPLGECSCRAPAPGRRASGVQTAVLEPGCRPSCRTSCCGARALPAPFPPPGSPPELPAAAAAACLCRPGPAAGGGRGAEPRRGAAPAAARASCGGPPRPRAVPRAGAPPALAGGGQPRQGRPCSRLPAAAAHS